MLIRIKWMSKIKIILAIHLRIWQTSGASELILVVPLVPLVLELILVALLGFYFREDKYFVCAGCKFFYNVVMLVLHSATTSTSHACLRILQTMKIASAASAKPAKPISNMQID